MVDSDGRFVGLIPPDRMLAVLLAEHDEDLARIGGYLAGSRRARGAAEESVTQRLYHRLPWQLLGLVGAMTSALLVGAFEEQLDKKVLLAFFVPAVVYMADAVGTQTETVLIRGLSVGVTVREVALRELLTGAVVGAVVRAAFVRARRLGRRRGRGGGCPGPVRELLDRDPRRDGVAVAISPVGRDPAFGSGPLATVLQDLLSIVVYLAIATPLAT